MKRIIAVDRIKNPYARRILSNILHKDPMKVYSQTPKTLKRLLKNTSEAKMRSHPFRGKWSIGQIISHLCDAELVMGFRYRMALAQSGSALQAYDQDKWADNLGYQSNNCRKKLELFIRMREDHIALLRSLKAGEWERFGMHTERGKETVERMLQMNAGHDVNHVKQIRRLRDATAGKKSDP